jgi:hypothetical protein
MVTDSGVPAYSGFKARLNDMILFAYGRVTVCKPRISDVVIPKQNFCGWTGVCIYLTILAPFRILNSNKIILATEFDFEITLLFKAQEPEKANTGYRFPKDVKALKVPYIALTIE